MFLKPDVPKTTLSSGSRPSTSESGCLDTDLPEEAVLARAAYVVICPRSPLVRGGAGKNCLPFGESPDSSDEPDGIEKNNTSSAYIEEMNP